MTHVSIHKLGADEAALAAQILALFQGAFELEARRPPPEYLEGLLGRDDFHAIAALREGAVVGALTAYELALLDGRRELFVYDVAVAEPHRREGIGRALIEFARGLCEERGLSAMFVAAHAEDAGAVRFYEAAGLDREDVALFTHEFEEKS